MCNFEFRLRDQLVDVFERLGDISVTNAVLSEQFNLLGRQPYRVKSRRPSKKMQETAQDVRRGV